MVRQLKATLFDFVIYVLGFLLLWEWLRPLPVITDISHIDIFLIYAAFVFLVSFLEVPLWLSMPIKAVALLVVLHALYFFTSLLNPWWIGYIFQDVLVNMGHLVSGDWQNFSNLFRSFLFLVLLWSVSYLMYYWIVQARRVFLFFLMTILFVTVVDTFTDYDANAAIVRTVVIGFALLGLLRFVNIQEHEKMTGSWLRFFTSWTSMMIVCLVVATTIGFSAPKLEAQWPDPVPFIKSSAQKYYSGEGSLGRQRVGYSTNDSNLGGSIVYNDKPVFTVKTQAKRYWRVEVKSVYTGQGWQSSSTGEFRPLQLDASSQPNLYLDGVKTEKKTAVINLADEKTFPQLVYGGELLKVTVPEADRLLMNHQTEMIHMMKDGEVISADHYTITYQVPTFSIEMLQEKQNDPAYIKERYLQLPDSLPVRIKQLTKSITKEADNRYDKVMAVDQFLNGSAFEYATKNIASPREGQDYVGQFLFTTKRGYCDNFSSSMAVMLRTIGIPTRWVKGFRPGELQKTLENGFSKYKVTNAQAHSWVEVYFTNVGWVPFEPTKGAVSMANFVESYRQTDDEASSSLKTNTPESGNQQQNTGTRRAPEQQKTTINTESGPSGTLETTSARMLIWGLMAGFVGVIGLIIFLTRKKWLPRYFYWRYQQRRDDKVFSDAYERLLKLLPYYGLRRRQDETLREFSQKVDQALRTTEMSQLTGVYEKIRYQKNDEQQAWHEMQRLWYSILKKLS